MVHVITCHSGALAGKHVLGILLQRKERSTSKDGPWRKGSDWHQAQSMMVQLFQNQQPQMEKLVQVRMQEAEASILIFSRQQELSEKIEAQEVTLLWLTEGLGIPKVTKENDTEAYLEASKGLTLDAGWNPKRWAS